MPIQGLAELAAGPSNNVNAQRNVLAVPALIARLLVLLPRTSIYVDKAHFQPWVYHELNQLLLNLVTSRAARVRYQVYQRHKH